MNKKDAILYASVAQSTYTNRSNEPDYRILAKFENKGTDTQGLFGEAYDDSFVVAFRGSEKTGAADWITDLKFLQRDFPYGGEEGLRVHYGFLEAYDSVREAVLKSIRESPHQKVNFIGHSLGAALATLSALDTVTNVPGKSVCCYTYGSPKVGNEKFAEVYNKKVPDTNRIVNDNDVVPSIPPGSYEHVGQLFHFGKEENAEYSWNSILDSIWEKMEDHLPHNYIKILNDWL